MGSTTPPREEHYLKRELYELVRQDSRIFDFVQAGSLDGLWYWDLVERENEWMSPRFWEVLGYDPADKAPLASEWQSIIDPGDLELALENLRRHCEDPAHPYDQVVRYRHRDGSIVWVRCRGLAIRDEAGTPVRMLGAHTDVTPLKNAEAALEAKALELVRSNTELERFAHVVSHDLQEPLRVVTYFAASVQHRCADRLDEQGRSDLELVLDGARRMQNLIRDLLEYARIGSRRARFRSTDLRGVVDLALTDLGAAIEESGAEITVSDLPTVEGDPVQLRRVFLNLIGNSIKFRSSQPPRIEVEAHDGPDSCRVIVADNGIGLDPARATEVFEMFRQLHARDAHPGNGIGLAIVKKIVEQHDGHVWLESVPGEGTRVLFTIPHRSAAPAS